MAWRKPRHSRSGAPVVEKDYIPQLSMPGVSDVVELKEEPWSAIIKGWVVGLIYAVLAVVITAALLYSATSATLFTADKLGEEDETSLVVRSQWRDTGGKPPVGEEAVISMGAPLPTNPLELVKQGWTGIPEVAVVNVLTTDYADIHIDPDNRVVTLGDGTPKEFGSSIEYSMPVGEDDPRGAIRLNGQYIVECVSGACDQGVSYLISHDQIYGKKRAL